MAYSDLSMQEKAQVIRMGVQAGLKSLKDIQSFYDSKVSSSVDYDLEGYYKEHPEHIFNHEGHYPDTFKKPNHPTFSDESIYHSEATPGGKWMGNTYEPSEFVLNQQGGWNQFLRSFYNQEQGTGAVPVFNGGVMLPEIEVRSSPKYKKSSEAYYDPETDTVFAPDSIGEFYTHERFHARPNKEYLQKIAPYYENLNDSVLTSMGADLPFVNRSGDPSQYYSPEEIGARVAASLEMLKKAGVSKIDSDFVKDSRKNELKYGDNYRDLLHMYNDDIITNLLNSYAEGGSIHIAPSKRGTFTAAATKHGKSVQAFASQVLANKENYSPAMVKKANFARNFGGHRHDEGGYNWRTPVGTNRTYLQTVKENAQDTWDKIRDNSFVNMVFPIKEVSEGHTEALFPLVVPGGSVAAETYRMLSPGAREALSMSDAEFKALYGVGKEYINTLLRNGNSKAVERAEKILSSIKSNVSNSPTVSKVRRELTDFLTSRLNRGDRWVKELQVDNVQNTPVRLWSETAAKSTFNESGLYTAPITKNSGYGNIVVQDATDIPTIRHELGHSTLQMGMKDPYGFLEESEEFLPIVDKGLPIEFQQYYAVPDEVRTRYLGLGVEAMKRNITPTQLYKNAMEYGPKYVNYDPDIVDLLTRYDKESVLNYLGNIHSNGGYLPGKVYDVSEQEYNRLKNLGYEVEIL